MLRQLCFLQWRLFNRTKRLVYIFISAILAIIVLPMLYISKYYGSSLYQVMYFFYQLAIIGLILFLYIGYEMATKSNDSSLYECLNSNKNGLSYEYFSTHIVLLVLSVLFYVTALLVNLYFYYIRFDVGQSIYLANLMKACILYFFVLPLAASTLGICISNLCKEKRILSYLFILFFIVVNTSYIDSILFLPFNLVDGKNGEALTNVLFDIKNIFTLTPHGLVIQYYADSLYGIPVEPARWYLAIFLISFAGWRVYNSITLRSSKGLITICLIITMCIGLVGFFQKGSFPTMDMRPNGFNAQAFQQYGKQEQVVPLTTDHAITGISGKIDIKNQIYASLDVTLKHGTSDEYVFTLYKGFKINTIVSNDKQIAFVRDGDYFYINKKDIQNDTFTIDYCGFSPQLYSNRQGIVLPGYYPYYPFEGIKPVYDISSQTFDISYPKTKRFFDIEVNSPLPLISNIDQTNQRFIGNSYTFSLFGGNIGLIDKHFMIYGSDEEITNNKDIMKIYEADVTKAKAIAQVIPINMEDYSDGQHRMYIIPQVFIMSGVPFTAFLGDHFINTGITWDGSILASDIPISKRTGFMRNFFISYMDNHDIERIEYWKSLFPDYDNLKANDYIQQIYELETMIDFNYTPNLTIVTNVLMPGFLYLIDHDSNAIDKMYRYLKSDHVDTFGEIEYLKSELEVLQ